MSKGLERREWTTNNVSHNWQWIVGNEQRIRSNDFEIRIKEKTNRC